MRFCGDAMASNAGGGSRRLLVDAVEQLFDSGLCVRNPLRPALGTAVREVGGDPGRAERVATDFGRDAGRLGAAADHAPGVGLVHGAIGQRIGFVAACGAEQPAFAVLGNAGSAQGLGERVMTRHRMFLAAFFVQPDRPSGAARPEIFEKRSWGATIASPCPGSDRDATRGASPPFTRPYEGWGIGLVFPNN